MTIEINKPELAALIQRRLGNGEFGSVEELLTAALSKLPDDKRFNREFRREAVRRMKEFGKETKLSLGEPVTCQFLHEGHRY
jgi:Arc/MetJ-type ribon-helix-helix transcriptional regulator